MSASVGAERNAAFVEVVLAVAKGAAHLLNSQRQA